MGILASLFEFVGYRKKPHERRTVLSSEAVKDVKKTDGKSSRLMRNWAGQPMLVESFSGEWCPVCGDPLPQRKGLERFLYGETGHYCRWWMNP